MIQQFVYIARQKLSCAGCDSAEIIICLSPALVAPHLCNVTPVVNQPFPYSTIQATLVNTKTCNGIYKYTITYEDTQVAGQALLTSADVQGVFCKGCTSTWVLDMVGNEVSVRENDDGSTTLITQHGCEYPVMPSPEEGCELICVTDYGAVGDGVTDDTAAFQAAIASGLSFYVPQGVYRVSQINFGNVGQSMFGLGEQSIIRSLNAALDTIVISAEGVELRDLQLQGIAANDTTSGYAIRAENSLGSARFLRISSIKIYADDPLLGYNNGIYLGENTDASIIENCFILGLQGAILGTGVGIRISSPAAGVFQNKIANISGALGRGRHGIVIDNTATNSASISTIANNFIAFVEREGIIQSLSQPGSTFSNKILNNLLYLPCFVGDLSTAGISIYGAAQGAVISSNNVISSGGMGILLNAAGLNSLENILIQGNTVDGCSAAGISLTGAKSININGNNITAASQSNVGVYSAIIINPDGADPSDNVLVNGNLVDIAGVTRSPLQVPATLPQPPHLVIDGNFFPVGNIAWIELNGTVATIEGRIEHESALFMPAIPDGTSTSFNMAMPGAEAGDICTASHTSDMSGLSLNVYGFSPSVVTLVLMNLSGAPKGLDPGTLRIDIWKRNI